MTKTKLWGGRFDKATNKLVEEFTNSIHFDKKLAGYDCIGSLYHISVLKKAKLLTAGEYKKLESGLNAVLTSVLNGSLKIDPSFEDIHSYNSTPAVQGTIRLFLTRKCTALSTRKGPSIFWINLSKPLTVSPRSTRTRIFPATRIFSTPFRFPWRVILRLTFKCLRVTRCDFPMPEKISSFPLVPAPWPGHSSPRRFIMSGRI
jgi:hypothetical protein